MATAKAERENAAAGKGPLGKAADDEPVFILRAQDAISADLIEMWAVRAAMVGAPAGKVSSARQIADDFRRWPTKKNPD